ncbi:NADH-quinone oxidoreductase subunit J [Winogradskya consettensis]|uniref:NADH-quinone oxidoreductase subunit J n=2 Tax=Winogradskya TaxID=3240235 RepID=A0A919T1G9_9ACTN|nr:MULTISPECIES: NADH-quinone oxidoreductase subunit J [Actinoplanes]GIE19623.1 NADH:ubiquinone oxidoreductase subunit J [Actinoplanes humidus]GIM82863.1 NADH:ubiquinone oxidoreductase subunit J [Actinoplanes consettensis]
MNEVVAAAAGAQVSTGEAWAFWILGTLAVIGGLGTVLSRNAVHSALWLVVTMLNLGFIYVINGAPFLGAVQIIVYTGAIMMLFLFVLMLVGRDASDSLIETLRGQRVAAVLLGAGFGILIATGLARSLGDTAVAGLADANSAGNVQGIAKLLFTKYVFAFEVTSALLITAAVGAMVLAHVERAKADVADQVTRMKARFRPGNYPGPKAGPGVYANTMSVAAPGRLPDGNGSERTLSPILPVRELTADEAAPKRTEK